MTIEPPAGEKGGLRQWPHWWKLLLVASLALNLFAIGAFAAGFFRPEHGGRGWAGFSQLLPREFIDDLSESRRTVFLDKLKSRRDAFRAARQAMRAAALKLATALEANPYDEAPATAAIDDFTKVGEGLLANGTQVTLDVLKQLTPEERVLLAKRIRERAERTSKFDRDRDGGPPEPN
ncbi:MAG: periplasmic heavy metal sensor [Parvibaculaceae bacterium]